MRGVVGGDLATHASSPLATTRLSLPKQKSLAYIWNSTRQTQNAWKHLRMLLQDPHSIVLQNLFSRHVESAICFLRVRTSRRARTSRFDGGNGSNDVVGRRAASDGRARPQLSRQLVKLGAI